MKARLTTLTNFPHSVDKCMTSKLQNKFPLNIRPSLIKNIHFVALLASFTTKYDNNINTRVSAVTKTTLNLVL